MYNNKINISLSDKKFPDKSNSINNELFKDSCKFLIPSVEIEQSNYNYIFFTSKTQLLYFIII
jgi:hypothetical protein